jgi:hypothetical protein
MANNIITALSEAAITDAAWGFEFKYNRAEHIGILDNTLSSLARVLFDWCNILSNFFILGRATVSGGPERERSRGCGEKCRAGPGIDPSFPVCRCVTTFPPWKCIYTFPP